jgi:nucleotide-binding universal stress UspA family protein
VIDLREILVATDFSGSSATALSYGCELAARFTAHLHVVTVVENFFRVVGIEGYLTDAGGHHGTAESVARSLLDRAIAGPACRRVKAKPVLLSGSIPAVAIAEYARDYAIDLIVIGAHGRAGFGHRLFGGASEEIARLAPCPVLTVKPGEHEFVLPDSDSPERSQMLRRS